VLLLIADGRLVVQGRGATMRVVPPLDVFEDGEAGLGLGREAAAVQELALERREETLAVGVIVGVADGPHRGPDTDFPAPEPEGDGRVLTALIGAMGDGERPVWSCAFYLLRPPCQR
jgi:hypothetical protein